MITLSVMSCPSKAVVILLKEKSSGVIKSSISIAYQVVFYLVFVERYASGVSTGSSGYSWERVSATEG